MPRPTSTRHISMLLAAILGAAVLAACGGSDGAGGDAPAEVDFSARAVGEAFNPDVQPQIINSALAVGPNRVIVALFTADIDLVHDAEGVLRLYRLDEAGMGAFASEHLLRRATIAGESEHEHSDGSTHLHDDPFATVYLAHVDFPETGKWGVAFSIEVGDERYDQLLASPVVVLDRTPEPGVGDPLPASTHLTLRDVADVSEINSSQDPIAAMNELTVAEALQTGKPVLVAIATPAFCQSRFCGPMMDGVVHPLYEEFSDRVQFVHIEPFLLDEARNNQRLVPVPIMAEWRLRTEPWIFIADADGAVVAKFEGITTVDEVRETLTSLLASGSGG